jgi:hypothetical protein
MVLDGGVVSTFASPSAVSSTFTAVLRISQAVYELKAVGEQTRDLLDTTKFVNSSLEAVRELRRKKSFLLNSEEKRWIDKQIEFTQEAVDSVASLIERARVDMQRKSETENEDDFETKHIKIYTRARFVLRDGPKVQTSLTRLSVAVSGLNSAMTTLASRQSHNVLLQPSEESSQQSASPEEVLPPYAISDFLNRRRTVAASIKREQVPQKLGFLLSEDQEVSQVFGSQTVPNQPLHSHASNSAVRSSGNFLSILSDRYFENAMVEAKSPACHPLSSIQGKIDNEDYFNLRNTESPTHLILDATKNSLPQPFGTSTATSPRPGLEGPSNPWSSDTSERHIISSVGIAAPVRDPENPSSSPKPRWEIDAELLRANRTAIEGESRWQGEIDRETERLRQLYGQEDGSPQSTLPIKTAAPHGDPIRYSSDPGETAYQRYQPSFQDQTQYGEQLSPWNEVSNANLPDDLRIVAGAQEMLHIAEQTAEPLEQTSETLTFVDSAYGTASYGKICGMKHTSPAAMDPEAKYLDDARTEYSDVSAAESKIYTYMECLADDLFAVASPLQWDFDRGRSLCKVLPDLLQQFALRIGQEASSKEGREVMVYVHRYRGSVSQAELYIQLTLFSDGESR